MAASSLKVLILAGLVAAGFAGASRVSAGPKAGTGPVTLDAQSSEIDLKTNMLFLRKPRISQGGNVITADQAQASREVVGRDSGVWTFRGNVKITMDQGQLAADDAQVNFVKNIISTAVATGKPAEFQQRVEKTGKVALGHADSIDYDAGKGVVRLTKNAWLSDGQNEVRGEALKYNVIAQTIVADAAEQGSQRVHIIITPPPAKP